MTIFQIIILIIIAFIIIKAVFKLYKKEISSWMFIIWIMFWSFVIFIDLFPESLSWLANKVGVGRGVDLIIYFSIILLFYVLFKQNVRLKKHEEKISEITQKLAIDKVKDNRNEK